MLSYVSTLRNEYKRCWNWKCNWYYIFITLSIISLLFCEEQNVLYIRTHVNLMTGIAKLFCANAALRPPATPPPSPATYFTSFAYLDIVLHI